MAIHQIATIDHPEAEKLCQLYSVDWDLASVIELCDSFGSQVKAAPHGIVSSELHDVYTVTILVRFVRAVSTGLRNLARFTTEDRGTLSPEMDRAWTYFDHLRDKHIAHSVNAFEEITIGFPYIVGEEDKAVITTLSTGGRRMVGLSDHQLHEMKQLCLALRAIVATKIAVENTRLLPILQSMPASQWTERGMRATPPLDHAKVGKPRKRQ